MTVAFAARALLPDGWARNVRMTIDADGNFASVQPDARAKDADWRCDAAIPGIPNLHSHAFQRGMAGLAERRMNATDSFWTWRTLMYRLALKVTPEQMEAIAAKLYVEMLRAGFTQVAEFHYLHHDPDGTPYADMAEMAQRLANASEQAGIGLTILPTLYAQSGFGAAPLNDMQRRFRTTPDMIGRIAESMRARGASSPLLRVGLGLHSLRAATIEAMHAACAIVSGAPVHIHVAEQQAEVDACLAATGSRPMALLLAALPVDRSWCLIHATHVTDEEIRGVARAGAVVGLCPITEANLGDGLFPLADLIAQGGRFGIGTDSNILVSAAEELRLLEYGQRLDRQERCIALASSGTAPSGGIGSVGRALFDSVVGGGAAACGLEAHGLAAGARADLVSLDMEALALPDLEEDAILDSALFACSRLPVRDVLCAGRFSIRDGRHVADEAINARFRAAMRALLSD